MMWNRYVRILVVFGMVAVMFGTVSAATGIVAETQTTSGGSSSICTAPCECMAESTAMLRWGAEMYERCTKTICGQSHDGMVQYYCIHQVGSIHELGNPDRTPVVTTTAQAAVKAPVPSATVPATPAAAGITQKSPVGIATILAAIGTALLAVAGMRRK